MIAALMTAVALGAAPPAQVDVSTLAGSQAETAVAVSPADPHVLLGASNSFSGERFDTLAYASVDGGATWEVSQPLAPQASECAIGDPAPGIDGSGRELLAYLAVPCGIDDPEGQISLDVSTRAGPRDPWTVVQLAGTADGWNDKPALTVDSSASSPHAGRAYVAWSKIARRRTNLVLSHSDDGGATWSPPVALNPSFGFGSASFFVGLAAAPDGSVYVVWEDIVRQVFATRSTDGGASFAPPAFVGGAGGLLGSCNFSGTAIAAQAHRCVTVNPTIVASSSAVTVVYAGANRGGRQLDIRARTFAPDLTPVGPVTRVSPADGKTSSDQFQPVAALDPRDGTVWVCYYDTRGDRTRRSARFACTASRDGGRSWSAPVAAAGVRSDESRPPANGFQFGDYQGLAIGSDGVAHPMWTDSRALSSLGEEIYTTTLTAAAFGY